jgi:DNA-directed RNA polymerase specialized sigma54-like protein
MPKPLTISEAARRLGHHRATVKRRLTAMGLTFDTAMTPAQFQRLKESFSTAPRLPRKGLRHAS